MIKRLEVKSLRGIKHINIHLDKRPILLFAENGKGKSSVIDAIEWALTGKINSLTGIQGVSLDKHAHHVSSSSNQKQVIIEMDDDSILSTSSVPDKGSQAEKLKAAMGSGLNILRRFQLLQAICASPKERYELLRPFLPLSRITAIESVAQNTVIKCENEKAAIQAKIRDLAIQIGSRLDIDTKMEVKSKNIIEAINKLCAEIGIPEISNLSKLDELKNSLNSEIQLISNISDLEKNQNILSQLKSISSLPDINEQCEVLKLRFEDFFNEKKKKDMLFNENVLLLGAKWIKDGNLEKCPLCMNPIETELVLEEIKRRVENEAEFIKIKVDYIKAISDIKACIEQYLKIAKSLSSQDKDGIDADLKAMVKEITDFCEMISISEIIKSPEAATNFDIPNQKLMVKVLCSSIGIRYEKTISSYGNTEKAIKIAKLHNAIICIDELLPQINKYSKEYGKLDNAYKLAIKWKEILESQRKLKVQGIYDSIKDQINDFYCRLHPKDTKCELVGGINLCVKETGGGSAMLQAGFYNKLAEDPRGYYSESHLDTLGLCIFLALYKKETDKNNSVNLLILDDVLTSVDAPHRKRVAELILSEFKGHQIIITTHDIVWCNDLIGIQRSYGNNFKVVKIDSWDIDQGPKFIDLKTNYDELVNLLSTGCTKGLLCSSAGTLLEFLLNRLRYSLSLAIPAKDEDKYTIGDIWPNFHSKVSASINKRILGSFYESSKACIEDIDLFWPVRNDNGCHYNEWAQSRADEEIREFAEAVIKFYEGLMCQDCGEVVRKANDKEFYCKCRKLNYSVVE